MIYYYFLVNSNKEKQFKMREIKNYKKKSNIGEKDMHSYRGFN